jgi:RNA polymerase sigma-70 factor (ECF subfamily)
MKRTDDQTRQGERGAELDPRVRRAQGGDARAYDALVREHYARVYATAFHLVGNHEDAEDLAQECFVRAHRSLSWYRGSGAFSGWLRRIVVHLVRDRFRSASRRPLAAHGAALEELVSDRGPAADAGARELQLALREAIDGLPEHLRGALVLRTLEGLDYDASATATGVTPATARTQDMKARRAHERVLAPLLDERRAR